MLINSVIRKLQENAEMDKKPKEVILFVQSSRACATGYSSFSIFKSSKICLLWKGSKKPFKMNPK